jgi:DNA-binding winged helix-turn-helix (wHTH) protein
MMESRVRPSYAFAEFVVSPARRALVRSGRDVPLIPRYFDLLVLLVERRGEAVSRREILDAVWSDVVVSDGALSQAIRTLRRALDDDPYEPVYIKTVSRHGYRFVYADVTERPGATTLLESPERAETARSSPDPAHPLDPLPPLLARLLSPGPLDDEERRDAAEALHALGTAEVVRRLHAEPGRVRALALLRDARWDVPGAGPVPLDGPREKVAVLCHLFALRLRRALRVASRRWLAAAAGAAMFGLMGGTLGGLALRFGPGSQATSGLPAVLALLGFVVGGLGGAGVGAGLAMAEALVRSSRDLALVVGGAVGGAAVGAGAHALALWTIESLFGGDLSPTAGGFEGLVLGAATGLGYALTTPRAEGGMASPHGRARFLAVVGTGVCGALAAVALAASGSYLGAMSLEFVSHAFPRSQVGIAPLSRLLGETEPGVVTRAVVSAGEGLLFGCGLALGLTRRPRRT